MHSASYSLLILISLKYPQHGNIDDRKSTVLINNNNLKNDLDETFGKSVRRFFFGWLLFFGGFFLSVCINFLKMCFVNKRD